MTRALSRRRAISILAAGAGFPLVSLAPAQSSVSPLVWRGQALGAQATLILNHPDKGKADKLINNVVSEVGRLEAIFSLYRESSALSELNRTGALAMPPHELVEVLEACCATWEASQGAFDPTIQPLWLLYARHFEAPHADPAGPSSRDVEAVRMRVGFDAVRFNKDRIAFARPDMALTLNGIAQGYITDVVLNLLKAEGITSSLVSMGEIRALGEKQDGTPWRVGLTEVEANSIPNAVVELVDRAVATSSGAGFHFDRSQRFSHILDPRSDSDRPRYRRISVIAPSATTADAYSTAFSLLDQTAIRKAIAGKRDLAVDIVDEYGVHQRI